MRSSGLPVLGIEFKRPEIVVADEWLDVAKPSSGTITLSQELRGYAHLYDLRTICCFDGAYLLVLWWPYASTGDVKDEEPEHWLFPVNSRFTLKEVVYRLLIEGIRRVLGANRMLQADQGNHSRPFGGWILIRDHRGRIFWRDPQGKNHWEHPKLKKQLDISNQRWVWLATTRNGEQVVHEEPNALWDIGS